MECLACAQCIDACDEVMGKLGRPLGLIRYDTLRGLEDLQPGRPSKRRWAYLALVVIALGGLGAATFSRSPFEARLMRAPGVPFVIDPDGTVRNQFLLRLVNKSAEARSFQLSSDGDADFAAPGSAIVLQPLESTRLPIFLSVPAARFHGPSKLTVRVRMQAGGREIEEILPAHLLGPLR